jgi:hypothetical protein
MPVIPTEGSINRKVILQAGLNKEQDTISKMTSGKRLGDMTQTEEHLPNKQKTLNSSPSMNNSKRKLLSPLPK